MNKIHAPFVYMWINKITNKWYIGCRTAKNCHKNDGYICSSKIVKPMIKENPEQWKRIILAEGTVSDMLSYEQVLLEKLDAKRDDNSFNCHNGNGKFSMAGKDGRNKGKPAWNKGLTKADPRVAKYVSAHIGVPVLHRSGVAHPSYDKPAWNKGLTKADPRVAKYANAQLGVSKPGTPHTEETKKKLSEQKQGSNNPAYGKPAWNKGIKGVVKQSEESKQRRADALRGRKRPIEVIEKIKATKLKNKLNK